MENGNKMRDGNYYEPADTEFCKGFNYEMYDGELWHKKQIQHSWDVHKVYVRGTRVKFIDIEDIEDYGFKLKNHNHRDYYFEKIVDDKLIMCMLNVPTNFLGILIWDETSVNDKEERLFQGIIRNKFEFGNVVKMLGI